MEENKIKEHPKVFISYAWTNEQHINEVNDFANQLRENGVDAKLDQWDLHAGQDMNKFMEDNINSEDILKVLIISNKEYANKANARKGGVGTETQIISPEVYKNTEQKKFIPLIWEKDENGKPYLPTYLVSRKGFDFSNENKREENLPHLLKEIKGILPYPKSVLGKFPEKLLNNNEGMVLNNLFEFIINEDYSNEIGYFELLSLTENLDLNDKLNDLLKSLESKGFIKLDNAHNGTMDPTSIILTDEGLIRHLKNTNNFKDIQKKIAHLIYDKKYENSEDISKSLKISKLIVLAFLKYFSNLEYIEISSSAGGLDVSEITRLGENEFMKIIKTEVQ